VRLKHGSFHNPDPLIGSGLQNTCPNEILEICSFWQYGENMVLILLYKFCDEILDNYRNFILRIYCYIDRVGMYDNAL
jgi:hypothetical protein